MVGLDYQWVEDYESVVNGLKERIASGERPRVAVDLETVGLYSWVDNTFIVSVSITTKPGEARLIYFKGEDDQPQPGSALWEQLHWLLTENRLRLCGANFKFDAVWMRVKWGITCTNLVLDTLLVGSLVDENRSNSLNNHAKLYTRMGGYDDAFNKKHDKSKMQLVPKDDLLEYAGGDTDATYRVADALAAAIQKDERLTRFYRVVLLPAVKAFEGVEERGLCIDEEKMRILECELRGIADTLESEALEIIPSRLRLKYKDNLSLGRPALLRDYLFSGYGLGLKPKVRTEKTGAASTASNHLKMFENDPKAAPFIGRLVELGVTSKTLSTFVVGFLKHLRNDGKLHPSYMLYRGAGQTSRRGDAGTVTGRTSASDPAIQTLPKHTKWAKRLRECYVAPEGKLCWQADFSQGELRIAACLANEEAMLKAYQNGIDLHAVTAAGLSGVSLDEFLGWKVTDKYRYDQLRFRGKAGNFGLLYGMGSRGFQQYAAAAYGIAFSMQEASEQRDAFFRLYPRLHVWHHKVQQYVERKKQIRSPLGRLRRLPNVDSSDHAKVAGAFRQAINAPVQSTLSDMTLWSVALIEKQMVGTGLDVTMMTHDSVAGYVPEDGASELVGVAVRIMENLPFEEVCDWRPKVRFEVDAEIGPNLADMVELAK
jgi:DNA polymerase I-like protein with 3'-5' exonuclease and polymerase domains